MVKRAVGSRVGGGVLVLDTETGKVTEVFSSSEQIEDIDIIRLGGRPGSVGGGPTHDALVAFGKRFGREANIQDLNKSGTPEYKFLQSFDPKTKSKFIALLESQAEQQKFTKVTGARQAEQPAQSLIVPDSRFSDRYSRGSESFISFPERSGGLRFGQEYTSVGSGIKETVKNIPGLLGDIFKGEADFRKAFEPLQDTGYGLNIGRGRVVPVLNPVIKIFFPDEKSLFSRPDKSLGELQFEAESKAIESGQLPVEFAGLTGRPAAFVSAFSASESNRIVAEEFPRFQNLVFEGADAGLVQEQFQTKVRERFERESILRFEDLSNLDISKSVRRESARREILGAGNIASIGFQTGAEIAGLTFAPEIVGPIFAVRGAVKTSQALQPGLTGFERGLGIGLGIADIGIGGFAAASVPRRIRAAAQAEKLFELQKAQSLSLSFKMPGTDDFLVVSGKRAGTATQFQELELGELGQVGGKDFFKIKSGKVTTEVPGLFGGLDESFAFAEVKTFKGGLEASRAGKIKPDVIISKESGAIDFRGFESTLGTAFIDIGGDIQGIRFAGGVAKQDFQQGSFLARETFGLNPNSLRIRAPIIERESFTLGRVFKEGSNIPVAEAKGFKNVLKQEGSVSVAGPISGRGFALELGTKKIDDAFKIISTRTKGKGGTTDFSYLAQKQDMSSLTIGAEAIFSKFQSSTIIGGVDLIPARLGGVFGGVGEFAGLGLYERTEQVLVPKFGDKDKMIVDFSGFQYKESNLSGGRIPPTSLNLKKQNSNFGLGLKFDYGQGFNERIPPRAIEFFGTGLRLDEGLGLNQKQILDVPFKPQEGIITPEFDFGFRPLRFSPFGFLPPFPLPGFPEPKKGRVSKGRGFRRVPSLAALELGIVASVLSPLEETGFALRPIIKPKRRKRR